MSIDCYIPVQLKLECTFTCLVEWQQIATTCEKPYIIYSNTHQALKRLDQFFQNSQHNPMWILTEAVSVIP